MNNKDELHILDCVTTNRCLLQSLRATPISDIQTLIDAGLIQVYGSNDWVSLTDAGYARRAVLNEAKPSWKRY